MGCSGGCAAPPAAPSRARPRGPLPAAPALPPGCLSTGPAALPGRDPCGRTGLGWGGALRVVCAPPAVAGTPPGSPGCPSPVPPGLGHLQGRGSRSSSVPFDRLRGLLWARPNGTTVFVLRVSGGLSVWGAGREAGIRAASLGWGRLHPGRLGEVEQQNLPAGVLRAGLFLRSWRVNSQGFGSRGPAVWPEARRLLPATRCCPARGGTAPRSLFPCCSPAPLT